MSSFDIYPAIDLRGGRVVRLEYGDPGRETTFFDDPRQAAQGWIDQGARWLHVVNLDGAFEQAGRENWAILPELAALGVKIQFGGGLRAAADIERAFNAGVTRVILGTAAVEEPDLVAAAVDQYGPKRVAVALDARQGQVSVRGWVSQSTVTALELARQLSPLGLRTVIHTDIGRDGVLSGLNAGASAELARATGLEVIASGGVATLDDVRHAKALAIPEQSGTEQSGTEQPGTEQPGTEQSGTEQSGTELACAGLAGVVIGRALYDGRVDLAQAIAIAGEGS